MQVSTPVPLTILVPLFSWHQWQARQMTVVAISMRSRQCAISDRRYPLHVTTLYPGKQAQQRSALHHQYQTNGLLRRNRSSDVPDGETHHGAHRMVHMVNVGRGSPHPPTSPTDFWVYHGDTQTCASELPIWSWYREGRICGRGCV